MVKIHSPRPITEPAVQPSTQKDLGGLAAWSDKERATAIGAPSLEGLHSELRALGYRPHPHLKTWWESQSGAWAADILPAPAMGAHWARLVMGRNLGLPPISQWPSDQDDHCWVRLGAYTVMDAYEKGVEPQDIRHDSRPSSESDWAAYHAGIAMVVQAFKPGIFIDNPIKDASQLGPEHQVKIGDRVKSYDFPDNPVHGPHGRENCFYIGKVTEISDDPQRGPSYTIATEEQVFGGKPVPSFTPGVIYTPINGRPLVMGSGLSQVTHGVIRLDDPVIDPANSLPQPAPEAVAAVATLTQDTYQEQVSRALDALTRLDLGDGRIDVRSPDDSATGDEDGVVFDYSGAMSFVLDDNQDLHDSVLSVIEACQDVLGGRTIFFRDDVATLAPLDENTEMDRCYVVPQPLFHLLDPDALDLATTNPGLRWIRDDATTTTGYLFNTVLGSSSPPVLSITLEIDPESTPEKRAIEALRQAKKMLADLRKLYPTSGTDLAGAQVRTAEIYSTAANAVRIRSTSNHHEFARHVLLHQMALDAHTRARASFELDAHNPLMPKDRAQKLQAKVDFHHREMSRHAEALREANDRIHNATDKADRLSEEANRRNTPETHNAAASAWRAAAQIIPQEDLRTMAERRAAEHEAKLPKGTIPIEDTECHTWFERDRAHVELRHRLTDTTLQEWWDEAVGQAIEDGFLKHGDFHATAYDYAEDHGALNPGKVFEGWTLEVFLNEPALTTQVIDDEDFVEPGTLAANIDFVTTMNDLRRLTEERLQNRFMGAAVRARLRSMVDDEASAAVVTAGPRQQRSDDFESAALEAVEEIIEGKQEWVYDVTKTGPVELNSPAAMEYPHLRRPLLKLLERLDALTGEVPDDVKMSDLRGIDRTLQGLAENRRASFRNRDADTAIAKAIQARRDKNMDALSYEVEAVNFAIKSVLGLDPRQPLSDSDLSVLTAQERARWTALTEQRWESRAGRIKPLTTRETAELARLDGLLRRS